MAVSPRVDPHACLHARQLLASIRVGAGVNCCFRERPHAIRRLPIKPFVVLLTTIVVFGIVRGLCEQHVYVLAQFTSAVPLICALDPRNFGLLVGASGTYGSLAAGEIAYGDCSIACLPSRGNGP